MYMRLKGLLQMSMYGFKETRGNTSPLSLQEKSYDLVTYRELLYYRNNKASEFPTSRNRDGSNNL